MQIYFDSPEFDAQLLRTLSYTYYQGADIGDCLSTAVQIKSKDFDSWVEAWVKAADRVYSQAEASYSAGCAVSAKLAFLRASNYYRTAYSFLYGSPVDPRLEDAYEKHCIAFARAAALFSTPVELVQIPYEDTFLTGYFYKADDSPMPRPTVLITIGYEETQQEAYFIAGAAALSRGWNVIAFDGPGQGHALIKQHLYMRHDWEQVIGPVVDYLVSRTDVEAEKIALFGYGGGGYLASRAAGFEQRVAALVVNPGQYDAMDSVKKALPEAIELLDYDPEGIMGKFVNQALQNPMFSTKVKSKMWVHGVESPVELLKIWRDFNLKEVSKMIACPTLVMDSENETSSPGQAKVFYDALICPKEYLLFTAKEGAGERCEAGASARSHQCLFDWLRNCSNPTCAPKSRMNIAELIK